MQTVFTGDSINFSYNKKKPVLKDLTFSIGKQQIYGLLGPNGAGKSTLTRVMLGLDILQSGELKWFNENLNLETKKRIGYIPQDLALIYDLSAYENVLYFGKLYGLRGEDLKKQVEHSLRFVGLWEERKQKPKKFSGGMKRRLNIACGIVHKPEVIIFDEPTVGVDPQSRNHILDAIVELNSTGITIIYISHYMEEVERICTHVGIMDNGRLLCEGTLNEIILQYADQALIELELQGKSEDYSKQLVNYEVLSAESHTIGLRVPKNDLEIMTSIQEDFGPEIKSFRYLPPNLEHVFFNLTQKNLRN
ncbi:ABC transporter ATP-binding protein [Peribacillus sp. SCS-26]|uniref:ABC transporter ATP-binding protein n=1 Tax=Paraperibacillus marinus TaxID=3115295 RepID=UPI003905B7DE